MRSERFYYDGIRRIQEVVTDPLLSIGLAMSGEGGGELQQIAEEAGEAEEVDSKAATLGLEEGQNALQGGGSPAPVIYTYVAREYVWGTGDGHAGPDELLVQYGPTRAAWWTLQDAGGDVVAVCDLGGSGSTARVCGQWRYDAYGAATAAEHLFAFPALRCGHKALFFDRLDSASADSLGNEPPRLIPFAHMVVQMRNRAYMPQLGRFLQPDPNATALTLIEATSYHGRGMGALVAAFDVQSLYGDGINLYEYLGSSPWGRRDPLGLSWDPFSMVDEYQAEAAGNTAAFMSSIGQGLKATAVVAAQIASYLPFPFVGNLGEVALYAMGETSGEEFAAAMALGMIPGGKLAGKLGSFLGRIGSSAWSGAKHYAGMAGSALSRGGGGLMDRARGFIRKGCGCFEAQTEIWTARGIIPIEEVVEGDLVVATDECTGEISLRRVKQTFVRHGAPIVAMTMLLGGGQAQTLNTTEEHPFYVEGRGWVEAQNLRSGDLVRSLVGGSAAGSSAGDGAPIHEVESIEFTSRRAKVHNFEVEGVHTYRVGAGGVLVHNARACKLKVRSKLPDSDIYRPEKRGDSPFTRSGDTVELHHPNPRDPLTVVEMPSIPHRKQGNYRSNHPKPWNGMTKEERDIYEKEYKLYWEQEWDTGRFKGLPEKP